MEFLHADDFFATARERERIRLKRLAGDPPPWTDDKIFQEWRFCNVNREDDRTTVAFRDTVRSKVSGLQAVKATMIWRWFNRIETGALLTDLLLNGWNTEEARRRLTGVRPIVTGAYMIKTKDGLDKLEGLLWAIDNAIPRLPEMMESWDGSLQSACESITKLPFQGPFLAYEIVTDLRHTDILQDAPDIMTWANVGPGATRGLNYVVKGSRYYFERGSKEDQKTMNELMQRLLEMSKDEEFWPQDGFSWEMRTVEHWLCEYFKYTNAQNKLRLKRRFP